LTTPHLPSPPASPRTWSLRSITLLILAWVLLQIGGLFSPGLLDDVDSIYIEIAREMLHRHDFVTPYINGIRFFDKPPLMYWMAAASMRLFGIHDWAARLPLALSVLALLLAVYALGNRLFRATSPANAPDRGGFYAALALATSIGPYLYTRFFIPDILLALWMTLAVHLFLIALERLHAAPQIWTSPRGGSGASQQGGTEVSQRRGTGISQSRKTRVPHLRGGLIAAKVGHRESDPLSSPEPESPPTPSTKALLPCLAFAAVMALNVLTKGLIGLVFPIAFVLLYLALAKQLRLLFKLHLVPSALVFLAIAAPWHILAALRNPAIVLPPDLGLPQTAGWAWFYLYNEHIARFLSKRIPHDYGLTPVWLFWLYLAIWVMPWATFLPTAISTQIRSLRAGTSSLANKTITTLRQPEAALSLLLWAIVVLGFFTLSNRQEYYSLPAIPALALMAGGLLAKADIFPRKTTPVSFPRETNVILTEAQRNGEIPVFSSLTTDISSTDTNPYQSTLNWHLFFLLPLTTILAIVCATFAFTAPQLAPNTDIVSLLAIAGGPEAYNLSLSHISDLTSAAMGFFGGPLAATALGMLGMGMGSYLLRRRRLTYAANLTLAASMICVLMAAHEGLARFYPILGSKPLAEAISQTQQINPHPDDLILLDGELTSGSSLIFYTGQQIHLLNGRVNGLWYGSFWPDAPQIFETEESLHQLWSSPRRIFLLTYHPKPRTQDLTPFAQVRTLATAGGKTILTNH
jgi:4-amino-4-deoxy-L-arabinose transferase-like glycosyltransferase